MASRSNLSCSVYLRPEAMYVFANTRSAYGSLSATPPVVLDNSIPESALGNCIIEQMGASKDVGMDINLKASTDKFRANLGALGFRSLKSFCNGARYLYVSMSGDQVLFEEWENNGKGGFLGTGEPPKVVAADPSQVGRYLSEMRRGAGR